MLGAGDDDDDDTGGFGIGGPMGGLASAGGSGLKNLFGLNAQMDKGDSDFKWTKEKKPKKKGKKGAAGTAAAVAPSDAQKIHHSGAQLFRVTNGQYQPLSMAMCALMTGTGTATSNKLMAYDREKRSLIDTQVEWNTKYSLTESNGAFYGSITDTSGQQFSMQFRTSDDAQTFAEQVSLCKYQASIASGINDSFVSYELLPGVEQKEIAKGDVVGIKFKAWTVNVGPIGEVPKFTNLFESAEANDLKKLKVGEGDVMNGFTKALTGMTKGSRRMVFYKGAEMLKIPNMATLGHPIVTANDTVAISVELVRVKGDPSAPATTTTAAAPTPATPAPPPPQVIKPKEVAQPPQPVEPPPVAAPAPVVTPPPTTPSPPPQTAPAPAVTQPVAPAPAAAAPNPNALLASVMQNPSMLAAGGMDMNALPTLMAMLQQPNVDPSVMSMALGKPPAPAAPVETPVPAATGGEGGSNADVVAMIQKVIGKVNRVGEKVDQLDLPSRLAVNNTLLIQSFHNIVKDMMANVGVGGEAPSEWRQEQAELKKRLQDVQAEQVTTTKMLEKKMMEAANAKQELEQERESVDARLDQLRRTAKQEREEWKAKQKAKAAKQAEEEYQRGFADGAASNDTGAVAAAHNTNANELQDLREQLAAVRSAAKVDRQEKDAQIESLQKLLERHEQTREEYKQQAVLMADRQATREDSVLAQDVFHARLKRVMNGVYFGMEEELPEDSTLTPKQVLRGLVKVIKDQTKRALEGAFDEEEEEEAEEEDEEEPPPLPQ
eukprot:TRINITY_DN66942_c8_g2_i2.p1 TRINITY_DN66942_c8_g2~~TRINITY_DN66942_c8_g2_i2.p1  ORF type:complete len:792 (+),score=150.25 TRINITY_DN66942_c8_g2_i2:57-2378(+)